MDQQFDFRALLVKLQDCLSDNDRRRLHFIVGDTIPRYLRDDPTLGGTLSLLESLFDRAIISEQDFDYLIHAFNEINCYEAVNRLKEHQLAQLRRNRSGTATTNVSDLFEDNELDKIKTFSNYISSDSSEPRDSTSSEATTISFVQQNLNKDIQSENKQFNIAETCSKQTLKSRLTLCQFILFILNFAAILTLILLIIFLTKSKHSISDILLIKTSIFYGNVLGGNAFNDAQNCSLTFVDKIVKVHAGWTLDTLEYVTFYYSNGEFQQHGLQNGGNSPFIYELDLDPEESINNITIYIGTRSIVNPYEPNGSLLVVGLRFYTDKGQSTDLLGSSNGTKSDEFVSGFTLAYIRGRALAYIDAMQFIWYNQFSRTNTAVLPTY